MSPLTVAHGDFRLDNLFFGSDSTDYELAVIDWQLANRGWGTYDIAYFIATNLDSVDRQKCEFDLLRAYHQRLYEGSVRDYSWQQCEDDYRRAMVVLVTTTITGITNIDPANERGVALFDLILRRVSAAVTDLDAFRMLKD